MSDLGRVQVHLHHTMTGSYPLRLLDVLFCADRAVAVEYGYVTPFDLVTGGAQRRADGFAATLESEGLAAAIDGADRRRTVAYDRLTGVTVFDGGWVGREKVVLDRVDAPPLSVRVHGEVDLDRFTRAVRSVLEPYEATVEREGGAGVLS